MGIEGMVMGHFTAESIIHWALLHQIRCDSPNVGPAPGWVKICYGGQRAPISYTNKLVALNQKVTFSDGQRHKVDICKAVKISV